jgi:2-polyprenyl-3-methyl-5-hydroxy-6-metoxy-1,4-benzoquinol methylase
VGAVSDSSVSTVLVAALDPPVTLRYITEVTTSAWQAVAPGGRLIVAAPNPAALPKAAVPDQRLNRRRLTRLLRTLHEPRLLTEQPYRWLAMSVRKPAPGAPRLKRPRRDRYAATAALCRGSVVELGCGAGDLAAMIAERGHPVVGVDISARKIAAARAAFPELTFKVADMLTVDLADEPFDTAVIAEVLEHVDDRTGDAMLERAWGMVRSGGRLIVSVPNEDCVPHRNHIREFDARGLAAQLRRFGRPRGVADQPFKWLLVYVRKET